MRTVLFALLTLAAVLPATATAGDPANTVLKHDREMFVKRCSAINPKQTGFECRFNRADGSAGLEINWINPPSKNFRTEPTSSDEKKIYEMDRLLLAYRELGGGAFTVRYPDRRAWGCTFVRRKTNYVCND